MSKACATCDREDNAPSFNFPIVGMVCRDCYELLSLPMVLEGAIEGPSLMTVCRESMREFERRRESLRTKAKDICKPPTAPVRDRREGRD